jgi:hypothetical protein
MLRDSIRLFTSKGIKSQNASDNKLRELIIAGIINKTVPDQWMNEDESWRHIRNEVIRYMGALVSKPVSCKIMAGRTFSYDFLLNDSIKVEFKYNCASIDTLPQFVQVSKLNRFLTASFEEFFYDNYLPRIAGHLNLPLPDKSTYVSQVNSLNPECLKEYKSKYKADAVANKKCNELSKQGIQEFIRIADLNLPALSAHLLEKQTGKHYMLWNKDRFIHDQLTTDDYCLVSFVKDIVRYRYIVQTKSGRHLHVLLRWKNGNGIAHPAFQISLAQ